MKKVYSDIIDQYEDASDTLRQAIQNVTRDQAVAHLGPGDWSIHELVIHIADTDAIAIDRMKRVLTEENPPLLNADESAYIKKLFSHEQGFDDAVMLIGLNRSQCARMLRCLDDRDFKRFGTHNLSGKVTLQGLITAYTNHLHHHLGFLKAKLERLRTKT